jgi:hypothetical protein
LGLAGRRDGFRKGPGATVVSAELVNENFDYAGGRQVTVYVPATHPEVVVYAGDGQLISS